MRQMLGIPDPAPSKFMWPVFVVEDADAEIPIESMPGQARMGINVLKRKLEPVIDSGVNSIIIFGVQDGDKDNDGNSAYRDDGVVQKTVRALRESYPDLLIFTDVCLCAYTSHGHCGPLTEAGEIDNDASIHQLAKTAVSHAAAGAHGVAPSAMMDGQVQAIRRALGVAGHDNTILMSYSTKFASAMYGPFRDAACSAPGKGDRQSYQAPYNEPRQAFRESLLDIEEGADILMVKPALLYLDLIATLRRETSMPLAAYNVSGEYSMAFAMADKGWADLESLARESISF